MESERRGFYRIHAGVGIIDKVLSVIQIDKELLVGCYRSLQRLRIHFNKRCEGIGVVSVNLSSDTSCILQHVEARADHAHEAQIVIHVAVVIR